MFAPEPPNEQQLCRDHLLLARAVEGPHPPLTALHISRGAALAEGMQRREARGQVEERLVLHERRVHVRHINPLGAAEGGDRQDGGGSAACSVQEERAGGRAGDARGAGAGAGRGCRAHLLFVAVKPGPPGVEK